MRVKRFGCWVVVGCLFALGQCYLYAQQSKIPWSSLNSGFMVMSSGGISTKSAVGQMTVGFSENTSIRIESGFLADTSLRGIILAVKDEYGLPLTYSLEQNYPNPFNPKTDIRYQIAPARPDESGQSGGDGGFVSLKIYDVLGREVATLVNEVKPPGIYSVSWNANGFPSGVYFYRLQVKSFVETKKLLLLK